VNWESLSGSGIAEVRERRQVAGAVIVAMAPTTIMHASNPGTPDAAFIGTRTMLVGKGPLAEVKK
jgi:hypothetical protein